MSHLFILLIENSMRKKTFEPKNQEANNKGYVRFEVFIVVTMKNVVFWDVMPHGSFKNRRFRGTWYFFAACVGC
jgi:hypothetical protein